MMPSAECRSVRGNEIVSSPATTSYRRSISAVLLLINGIAQSALIAVVVVLVHPIDGLGFVRAISGLMYVALMLYLAYTVMHNRQILFGAVVSGAFGACHLFFIPLMIVSDFPHFLSVFGLFCGITLTTASILLIMEYKAAKKRQPTEKVPGES